MFLKDNFSEVHLLFSEPVNCALYKDEKESILLARFIVKLPTIRDLYFNTDVMFTLSILKQTIADLNKHFNLNFEFTSHLHFIQSLITFKEQNIAIANCVSQIVLGLQFLCSDINISQNQLTIKNREVNDQIFERLRDMWLISIDAKTFSKAYQYMSPEERKLEEKIQSIKNKGKNKNDNNSFEKIYITLTYEFNYSRNEILEMTMYAIKTILKYTSKSINYKLTLMAKAYGNTKKVRFITDKGE